MRAYRHRLVGTAEVEACYHRCLPYEQLLSQPEPALEWLGRWLEVDPSGFRRSILGRPRPPIRFEPAVEARILEIAGPALRALGYADVPESR